MSELIEFYRGNDCDDKQRTIYDILDANSKYWEECHNFIQWLFPLPEPSQFNKNAPLLTQSDIEIFIKDEIIQENIEEAYHKFLDFLGLYLYENKIYSYIDKPQRYLGFNHNHLRITRVLRFLTLTNNQNKAKLLYDYLYESQIPATSFIYWKQAIDY